MILAINEKSLLFVAPGPDKSSGDVNGVEMLLPEAIEMLEPAEVSACGTEQTVLEKKLISFIFQFE